MNVSKVMGFGKGCECNLKWEYLEEVECIRYLGMNFGAYGNKEAKVSHWAHKGMCVIRGHCLQWQRWVCLKVLYSCPQDDV